MATFSVDLSNLKTPIWQFPNGPIEATIVSAKVDVAASGNPKLAIEWEVYHPEVGTATLYDNLPSVGFDAKVAAFWMALNELTPEDIQASPKIDIDPGGLRGAQMIVQLGEQERKDKPGTTRKSVVAPWYYPISKAAELLSIPTPL